MVMQVHFSRFGDEQADEAFPERKGNLILHETNPVGLFHEA
jgi:hypothetical protein